MIKNIIILILFFLLVGVSYKIISPEQIGNLGNETFKTTESIIKKNKEILLDGKSIEIGDLLKENGKILKDYGKNSISILLEDKNLSLEEKKVLLDTYLSDKK